MRKLLIPLNWLRDLFIDIAFAIAFYLIAKAVLAGLNQPKEES